MSSNVSLTPSPLLSATSTHTTSTTPTTPSTASLAPTPLNILIAGAGIGGLTAALGLRQQGHRVTIFEASRFAVEYGAGLAIPSNATGILSRLGIDLEQHCGATRYTGIINHRGSDVISSHDLTPARARAPHPYFFVLRRDLHGALKRAATSADGAGTPVKLLTSTRVRSVDAGTATITLEDGTQHAGDVVVGADGVRSRVRAAVAGSEGVEPFKHRMNTFRFLVDTDALRADRRTAGFVDRPTWFRFFQRDGKLMIMYPGAAGRVTNVACCYPQHLCPADDRAGGVHTRENKAEMMRVYEAFGEGVLAVLEHADEVGNWPLMSMDELPRWTQDKVALVGDAAHPLLPFVAQGCSMAIEDGGALAALFPLGTEAARVPELLSLYEQIRYQRATLVQRASKEGGKEESLEEGNNEVMARVQKLAVYLESQDPWEMAERALSGEKVAQSIPPELQSLTKNAA